MFNDKPYMQVNREERHFCALFAHALLSSAEVRAQFSNLVSKKLDVRLVAEPMEVFLEAAALRDYWHDLGDAVLYSVETHRQRRAVLNAVLAEFDIPSQTIDEHDFFWTSSNREKLWSPGRWNTRKIGASGLDEDLTTRLVKVKWAFNAKPDIMILCGTSVALMIEGKLESGEGRDEDSGYRQFEIQELIARCLKRIVPVFRDVSFFNMLLALRPESVRSKPVISGVSWREVIGIIERSDIDEPTRRAVGELKRFY